jgi:hypothetical protein
VKDVARYTKRGLTLVPADKEGASCTPSWTDGGTVFVQLWLPRNMAQHRKYFAVLRNVVEATGNWTSSEHLRRDILIGLKRFDEEVNKLTGEVRQVPHSMAVASMPKGRVRAALRRHDQTADGRARMRSGNAHTGGSMKCRAVSAMRKAGCCVTGAKIEPDGSILVLTDVARVANDANPLDRVFSR